MTSASANSNGGTVTLEQLASLNAEIVSLVRAGVPLEMGLKELGRDTGDALGRLAAQLSDRMSGGKSLAQALAEEGDRIPEIYRIVVEAGLRSGRLPAALEAISSFAWELVELRRRITSALLYPMIVLITAYCLFFVFIVNLVDRYQEAFRQARIPTGPLVDAVIAARNSVHLWGWIPPVVFILLFVWWSMTGGARLLDFSGWNRPIGWIPGMKRIGHNYRIANFSELLALMVETEVPLAEALPLAAAATGDAALRKSSRELAESISRGQPVAAGAATLQGFPAVLRWLLAHGHRQSDLSRALRLAAFRYRRRAALITDWFKFAFPVAAGIVIGGGITVLYAAMVFLPFIEMIRRLSLPELAL